jgi:hypothetical protein
MMQEIVRHADVIKSKHLLGMALYIISTWKYKANLFLILLPKE